MTWCVSGVIRDRLISVRVSLCLRMVGQRATILIEVKVNGILVVKPPTAQLVRFIRRGRSRCS